MPITEVYTCDCCGLVFNPNERYYHATIGSHNYSNLMHGDTCDTYVYCRDCSSALLSAIDAIPRIWADRMAKAEHIGETSGSDDSCE